MKGTTNKHQLTFLYILSFAILIALLALVTYLTIQYGKLSDQLFYLVLVVTGLTASIVLSKILKTTSSVATTVKGLDIKITGAGAIACIFVLMGYKFVKPDGYVSLIVNIYADHAKTQPLKSGKVTLEIKPTVMTEAINENGQARLLGIAPDYKSQLVYFRTTADGFYPKRDSLILNEDETQGYVVLERIPERTVLKGTILFNGKLNDPVRNAILYVNTDSAGVTDSKGSFNIEVPYKADTEIQFDVAQNGQFIDSRQLIVSASDVLTISIAK